MRIKFKGGDCQIIAHSKNNEKQTCLNCRSKNQEKKHCEAGILYKSMWVYK